MSRFLIQPPLKTPYSFFIFNQKTPINASNYRRVSKAANYGGVVPNQKNSSRAETLGISSA